MKHKMERTSPIQICQRSWGQPHSGLHVDYPDHTNYHGRECQKIASWLLGTFNSRSVLDMNLLYKTMVRSRFEYCSALWNPHRIQDIQTLEAIQRSFTLRVSKCQTINYWDSAETKKTHHHKCLEYPKWQNIKLRRNEVLFIRAIIGPRARVPPISKNCSSSVQSLYKNSWKILGRVGN
jgi:hypothetical protein